MKKVISTNDAPAAVGPYSQAVEAGNTLYISGQLPIDPATGAFPETIEEQTEQVFANLAAILKEAGYSFDNIVKTTVLLDDIANFTSMNLIYAKYFTGTMPARACYQVAALPKSVKIEIEAIAVK